MPRACYSALVLATIALFDVDGTLLRAAGAGTRSLETVFKEAFGQRAEAIDLDAIDFSGRTDPWIVRTALSNARIAYDEHLLSKLTHRYEQILPAELHNSEHFRLCPGASQALAAFERIEGLCMGLGTGNLESCAYAKVEYAGLRRHFHFGGFGSDSEDRTTLLRAGADRGIAFANADPDTCRVIVVGDTPRDVVAGHAIGAEVIGVATGVRSLDELREAHADLAVETLLDPRVFEVLAAVH